MYIKIRNYWRLAMITRFRVWDKHRNKMNHRVLVGDCDENSDNYTCPVIWIDEEQKWKHFDDYDCIMQSTGLKDKNGKEIFESDILYGNDGEDFWNIVEYDKENAKWVRSDVYCNSVLDLSDGIETLKVVGNIYENPEILR